MAKLQTHDDATQNSGSGSGFSDLSALENETDDFGRRLLQHQRDVQRINNAVHVNVQPFRKARPGPRLGEQLELNGIRDEIFAAREHERTGSGGSADSDPPLNIPREWGRKGKRRPDWLRNIHAPIQADLGLVNGDAERQDEDAIMPHRTAYTGDEDWNGEDEALPTIENDNSSTPPSMRRRRIASSPTSMRHMNTTIINVHDSTEVEEFSAASLLASTPAVAVRRRGRKIDEMTRREIESLERRGVTKRHLDNLSSPPKPTHETSPSPSPRPVSAPTDRSPRRNRSPVANNKENVQPDGANHTKDESGESGKRAEVAGLVGRSAQAVTFKSAQRPAHRRNDSMNLLKQLARVSSLSPGPAKSREGLSVGLEVGRTRRAENGKEGGPEGRDVGGVAVEERRRDEELEVQQRARVSRHVDAAPADIDSTAAPPRSQDAKKSVVTTTLTTTTNVRPLLQTTDSTIVRAFGSPSGSAALEQAEDTILLEENIRRVYPEPVRGKSALADILHDAEVRGEAEYGDATMRSLEGIVEPDLDATVSGEVDVEDVIEEVEEEFVQEGREQTQAQKDRRQEHLAMEAMNKHLRAARTSIKDADRGLRRVENRIETAQTPSTSAYLAGNDTTTITSSTMTTCAHCLNATGSSARRALMLEVRDCFFTFPQTSSASSSTSTTSYTPHPTYLGLLTLLWLLWLLTETALCELYCTPLYASHMRGYGVDPEAPRWPFVIPTLLYRPFGPWVEAVGHWFWGESVGETEPVLGRPAFTARVGRPAFTRGLGREGWAGEDVVDRGWVTTATATSARVVCSAVEAAEEVGRMWEDEVLVG